MDDCIYDTLVEKDWRIFDAFGKLIDIMGLSNDSAFILKFAPPSCESDVPKNFLDLLKQNCEDAIDAYIDLLKPCSANPKISLALENIEIARQKYAKLKFSLEQAGITEQQFALLEPPVAKTGLQIQPSSK